MVEKEVVLVITGCTGRLGPLVAEEIARRDLPMRLLVRAAARAPIVPGAEVVVADYGEPEWLARALREGDRVFMVSVHEGPARRVPLHRSFVEAAARARVAHVVYLSFVNAGPRAIFLHARSHSETEAMLERVNRVPGGEGRMSFTYRPELAAAIAVVLTEPGARGQNVRRHDAGRGDDGRARRDCRRGQRRAVQLVAHARRWLGAPLA
jgi:uncharacterized protein YbjT (DUF2867 family)